AGPRATAGAVLVPPLGYEYWTSYGLLRDLAWRLAERGVQTIRFDHEGTGDSGGDQWAAGLEGAWRRGLRAAVAALRDEGCHKVMLVGLRYGATLALQEAAGLGADAVAALAPVVSGKRYVRELAMLGTRVPADDPRSVAREVLISGGVPFPDELVEALRGIDLLSLDDVPPRVLLVADSAGGRLADQLRSRGADVVLHPAQELARVLEVTTEKAVVPQELVQEVADRLASIAEAGPPVPGPRRATQDGPAAEHRWRGGSLVERAVVLGDQQLIGVLGEPKGAHSSDQVVVFLNTGAEHHVGPGRAWVEYARALNLTGTCTLRLDFRGWGESVLQDSPPGRPYAASAVTDVGLACEALRARGFSRVVVVGLCSSAWIALRAATQVPIEGVYALNPQLYWQPGDPDDFTVLEAEVWRRDVTRREERLARTGLWTLLDVLGVQNAPGRWLSRLAAGAGRSRLVFAEGDLGHTYLRQRLAHRLRLVTGGERVSVQVIPGVDHQMHKEWLRPAVLRDLQDWLGAA
ncbi:MAG: hypothetical protein ABR549_14015, partial [Mycobacteriales bacterium]